MASRGCTEYPATLVARVKSEFGWNDYSHLHQYVADGVAWRIRKFLWQQMNLSLSSGFRRALRKGIELKNKKFKRAKRIVGLYNEWVAASQRRGEEEVAT